MSVSKRERTALLSTIAVLGAVPVATGINAIVGGTKGLPGGGESTASIDSEYRFVNVFWTAAGIILWWSLRQPEQRAAATRLMLALAAVGGLPRLLSWAKTGAPHPIFRGTVVLELVIVPLILGWHSRVFPRGA